MVKEINEAILAQLPRDDRRLRGNAYYESEAVTLLQVDYQDENNYRLLARVSDSYWHQYLGMTTVVENKIVAHYCECPDHDKGYLCKHIIAAVYQAVEGTNLETKYRSVRHIQEGIKSAFSPIEELTLAEKEYDKNRFKMWEYNRTYSDMNELIDVLDSIKKSDAENGLDIPKIYQEVSQSLKEKQYTAIENGTIRIEPRISFDTFHNGISVEFKIGARKMYLLKNLEEFYRAFMEGKILTLGKEFATEVDKEKFEPNAIPYLDFVLAFGKTMQYANAYGKSSDSGKVVNTKSVQLQGNEADEFMELLTGKEVEVGEGQGKVFVRNEVLPIHFFFEDGASHYLRVTPLKDFTMFATQKYLYLYSAGEINRVPLAENKELFHLLKAFHGEDAILLAEDKVEDLKKLFYKKLHRYAFIQEESEDTICDTLGVKVLLDINEVEEYVAKIKFCYGEIEFNPLSQAVPFLHRHLEQEKETLTTFFKDGFQIEKEELVLKTEESMYDFLQNRIEKYMKKFEVLATEQFSKRTVHKPKLSSVGIKLNHDLLEIDISKLDIEAEELKQVFQSYRLKKKYYKLKDGSFLDLQSNSDLDMLEEMFTTLDIDLKKIKEGVLHAPMNRCLYLQNILEKNHSVKVVKDKAFSEVVDNVSQSDLLEKLVIPKEVEENLRDYQRTGYKWLKVLEHYQFGGILADDMGLRKNIASHCGDAIVFVYRRRKTKTPIHRGVTEFSRGQLGSRNS